MKCPLRGVHRVGAGTYSSYSRNGSRPRLHEFVKRFHVSGLSLRGALLNATKCAGRDAFGIPGGGMVITHLRRGRGGLSRRPLRARLLAGLTGLALVGAGLLVSGPLAPPCAGRRAAVWAGADQAHANVFHR